MLEQRVIPIRPTYLVGLSGLLGLLWGCVNQPLPVLLRPLPAGAALWTGWMVLVWPLVFGLFLVTLARTCPPRAAALAGGCFAGGAVLGWFGCHLVLLGLGFGPPGTQWTVEVPDTLGYLAMFTRQTVLRWLLPALALGVGTGGLAGWVGRRQRPALRRDLGV